MKLMIETIEILLIKVGHEKIIKRLVSCMNPHGNISIIVLVVKVINGKKVPSLDDTDDKDISTQQQSDFK